jgi:hypothetical protein
MKALSAFLIAGWIAGAGCAAVSRSGQPADDLRAAEAELDSRASELSSVFVNRNAVDCGRAGRLRDNICTLAERICALAADAPQEKSGPGRCSNARGRCRLARERVAAACR